LQQAGPIGAAVARFVQAEDEQAAALLQSEAGLLLTLDAGDLLRQLAEAAQAASDEAWAARLVSRQQQQRAARVGGEPGGRFAQIGQQVGTQVNIGGDVQGQVGARYEIGVNMFGAVGENAVTINMLNLGAVALRWQRPHIGRPDLLEGAVGRLEEMNALRGRLAAAAGEGGPDVAIVGKRHSQAVSGMPGVGKSTLAALYVQACADYPPDKIPYPGGVLWLQLGPTYTTEASVQAALSGLAAVAYSDNEQRFQLDLPMAVAPQTLEQIQRTLQNAIFAPEAVQRLLGGHGRLLVVVDDLWERALWPTIRRGLPAEAHILVTTRDERVAHAVGQSLALDVLNREDALALIAQELPQMPEGLAERLVRVVGAHPMALSIALGDLHPDDPPEEWAAAIEHIGERLARGLGVDPTTLDKLAPERRLSAVLAYSYEALGRSEALQRCFRALGSLAAEAGFDTAAVAAVVELAEGETRELLKTLRDRNLVRRVDAGRWRQHALLRSYALEQETAEERLAWGERHARHYLAQMRAADDAQTYYTMRPELPNLRHAFAWASGTGRAPGLAQGLLSNCANLLASQNLGLEYLEWAEHVRALALQVGGPEAQGQALVSLGNALQNAATLADPSSRASGQRPGGAAAPGPGGLRRSAGPAAGCAPGLCPTQNNRAVLLSDLATLPGEDRGARLRQALYKTWSLHGLC